MKKNTQHLIITLLIMLTNSAQAGNGFNVTVGGDYDVKTKTRSVTSVAIVRGSADINVGGMQLRNTSMSIGRDYRVNVETGSVTAISIGFFGTGPINLAGIQSK